MKNAKYFSFVVIFICQVCQDAPAQNNRIGIPSEIFHNLTTDFLNGKATAHYNFDKSDNISPGAFQLMCKANEIKSLQIPANTKSPDTLIVSSDQLITGTYTQNGPIYIADNATLTIKNSFCTVLGDIYLFGHNSRLIIDSSTLYSPQQYFYQRAMGVMQNGKVSITNSTLDFSGLSHNVFGTDSSMIEMINVTKNGWATNGFYGNAKFYMENCNQAGEYIISNNIELTFKNTKTILLWHQFPDSAVINFSFPEPDTVMAYQFDNTLPGIDGIGYHVAVDSCYDVMWAIMPTTGSDVSISNSTLRAIGVWFEGNDTLDVSGLVNNSSYTNFTAPLSDRNLQLSNTSVQTWSLYPMGGTNLNISGCIVGEVGAMGHSFVNGQNFTVDGSGGYFWSSDTTITIAGFTTTGSYVRSERNGIFIYAYSSIINGYPSALGQSVIMVMQSNVPQPPVAYDGSAAWYGFIEQPFDTYVDTTVAITGSAWIKRGPTSQLMEFRSHHLYYQKTGEAGWTEISCDSLNPVDDDTLAVWNTSGLTAGQYNLKLVIWDNWGNAAEGVKNVNVMPQFMDVAENSSEENDLFIFPNPSNGDLNISYAKNDQVKIKICNAVGMVVCEKECNTGNTEIRLDVPDGIYFINAILEEKTLVKKIIIRKPF